MACAQGGRFYGYHPDNHSGSAARWRITDMAVQRRVGILPEWRIRLSRVDPGYFVADRSYLSSAESQQDSQEGREGPSSFPLKVAQEQTKAISAGLKRQTLVHSKSRLPGYGLDSFRDACIVITEAEKSANVTERRTPKAGM